jgi:hypothetical protein
MAFSVASCVIYNSILMTHLEEILVPYGYNDADVSTFGFVANLCGIVGGIITAKIIIKTGQYRNLAIILIICMSFTSVSF